MSKEVSSLYRTFSPSITAYNADGCGRDTYIGYNNGGFWRQGMGIGSVYESTQPVSTQFRFRSHEKHVPVFKYQSDGSGRDGYVIFRSGGLQHQEKALNEYHLKDFLRIPESCIFQFHPNPKSRGRTQKTKYISKQQWAVNQELKKNELGLITRLYSNQKHKFMKINQDNQRTSSCLTGRVNLPTISGKIQNNPEKDQFFIQNIKRIHHYEQSKKDFHKKLNESLHIKSN